MKFLRGTYPMVTDLILGLASLLWGVRNEGDAQRITIDHFTSAYVQGVKGEDIHRPIPKENGTKILVAVLDTGIDTNHPELTPFISDLGYNFVANNVDIQDQHGHGTHVSGIIALQATNKAMILPIKVVQTGPNAPIRPQSVEAGAGTALTENVAQGVVYAINKGAKVINLSLAWPASIRSKKMDEAMELAEQRGVLVIASAANDRTSANLYPCIYPQAICVGAHGPDGSFTYFSNHGSMVDLLAPGISILSTWPLNKTPVTFAGGIGHEFRNGTSMAAPYVSGAAAELMSRGFSANETRNRLLLGTRKTRAQYLYSSQIAGDFIHDIKAENRFARFGNLDIQDSIDLRESSLILPEQKARILIEWNGVDHTVNVPVTWINRWKKSENAIIRINGQEFKSGPISGNSKFVTELKIPLTRQTESTFTLTADVTTVESDGSTVNRQFPISFMVSRIISKSSIPSPAEKLRFVGIDPSHYPSIRTVIQSRSLPIPEYLLIKNDEIALTHSGKFKGKAIISDLKKERILNIYRINDSRLVLITTPLSSAGSDGKPIFIIRKFDSNLGLIESFQIATETTVLSENLIWKTIQGKDSLFWISNGFTPPSEKPPFDPWNPKAQDSRLPRIYYAWDSNLHSVPLEPEELPIHLFSDGTVLLIKGTDYSATYSTLSVNPDLKPVRKPLMMPAYRMLLGSFPTSGLLNLNGEFSNSVVFPGISNPGTLRLTTVNARNSEVTTDEILERESPFESILQLSGSYQNGNQTGYFAQSHYDLKFYRMGSRISHSVSLNRYSYVPSMIYNRNFFPLVAESDSGKRIPAIYIPASIANADRSEIIFGDLDTGEVSKPALYHIEAKDGCRSPGNLMPATPNAPAKQVFICGQEMILLPILRD